MAAVCDRNCFECIYDDCICNEFGAADRREMKAIDRELIQQRPPTYDKHAYYVANREKILAKAKARREADPEGAAAYHHAHYMKRRDEAIAYQKAYYRANRDEILAQHRAAYAANRTEKAAKQRAYYAANREAVLATQKKYRETHREQINAARKKYRETHREQINAAKRARYAAEKKREGGAQDGSH